MQFYKFLLDIIILNTRATYYYYLYSVLSSEKRLNDFQHDDLKLALDEIVDNYEKLNRAKYSWTYLYIFKRFFGISTLRALTVCPRSRMLSRALMGTSRFGRIRANKELNSSRCNSRKYHKH